MHRILFALPLLAATALAQTSTSHPTAIRLGSPGLNSGLCPMNLSTQLRGSSRTLWTIAIEDAGHTTLPSDFGVHVHLQSIANSTVTKVELAVHYLPAGTRVLPIDNTIPADALSKTFNLSAPAGGAPHLAADLLIGPSAGILRVNLLRVDFANGETWQAPTPNACAATPSLNLPVSAH